MSKRKRPTQQPNKPKVATPEQFAAEMMKPGLSILQVCHDDWCSHWRGKQCDCDPTIKLVRPFQSPDGSRN